MRHDDCGPDCDREFEDQLALLHAQARTDIELSGALAADFAQVMGARLCAARITGRPHPPARAD